MTLPANNTYVNGQGEAVSGDQLNTFTQWCSNVAALRDFIGAGSMNVYLEGYNSVNDGGQGPFYWNGSGTGPDDGGVTNVVPNGVVIGCWTRFNVILPIPPSRTLLTANTTYYVATTGNDSNPGTITLPWLTLQHANDYITSSVDAAGFDITVSVANGTYGAGAVATTEYTGGTPTFQGNLITPGNCFISSSGNCFSASNNARFSVGGFKVASSAGNGVAALQGGIISIDGPMDFSTCAGAHIAAAEPGSLVLLNSSYAISGNSPIHFNCYDSGAAIICDSTITVTLTGAPAFSTAFANISDLTFLHTQFLTFSGSATGKRFNVTTNGDIQTNTSGNLTYLPGDVAGTLTLGGIYDDLQVSGTKFTSGEIAVATGETDFAHGLGSTPSLFTVVARCKTADSGYSIGDEIDCATIQTYPGGAGGSTQVSSVSANATNVTLSTQGFGFSNKAGTTGFTVSNTNWKLVARAWI